MPAIDGSNQRGGACSLCLRSQCEPLCRRTRNENWRAAQPRNHCLHLRRCHLGGCLCHRQRDRARHGCLRCGHERLRLSARARLRGHAVARLRQQTCAGARAQVCATPAFALCPSKMRTHRHSCRRVHVPAAPPLPAPPSDPPGTPRGARTPCGTPSRSPQQRRAVACPPRAWPRAPARRRQSAGAATRALVLRSPDVRQTPPSRRPGLRARPRAPAGRPRAAAQRTRVRRQRGRAPLRRPPQHPRRRCAPACPRAPWRPPAGRNPPSPLPVRPAPASPAWAQEARARPRRRARPPFAPSCAAPRPWPRRGLASVHARKRPRWRGGGERERPRPASRTLWPVRAPGLRRRARVHVSNAIQFGKLH